MSQKILLLLVISLLMSCQNSQNQTFSSTTPQNIEEKTDAENASPAIKEVATSETAKNLVAAKPSKTPDLTPQKYRFPWLQSYETANMLVNRIAPPKGYERIEAPANSFAEWLQHLPLKKGQPPVYLFNGAKKGNQQAQFAVIDMDVGKQDLQQCADAVMRLRAEYLLATDQHSQIHFNFTNGDKCDYQEWKSGIRPVINGNKVSWLQKAQPDASYANFKRYMTKIFQFAGTSSLSKELKPVHSLSDIQAGDVFIRGGFPGHAVMVMDIAIHRDTGEKIFMLAQSYMPAQEMHILRNPNVGENTPWYSIDFEGSLATPEWIFEKEQLMRF